MSEQYGMEEGYRILSSLLAGLLLYGGLGWIVDRVWHVGFALPLGIIVGTVASLYVVIKRHAGTEPAQPHQSHAGIDREESQ